MKKTLIVALASASLLVGGVAIAQTSERGGDRGPMTRAEATEMAAGHFAKMDVNGDGQLDPSDRDAHMAERFAAADADGDGALTQAEMTAAREARKAERTESRAERGESADGERMGRRGDGKRGGKRGGHHGGKQMMEMADANSNGAVTLAEFQAAALARFDEADSNADGTVTEEEHKAARDAHRAERQSKRGGNRPSGRQAS